MPAKRKTIEALKREGNYRADRHARRREGKINFESASVTAPKWLSPYAKAEWRRVAPALIAEGMLAAPDAMIFAAYCEAVANWRTAQDDINRHGLILSYTATTRNGSVSKRYRNPASDALTRAFVQMRDGGAKFGLSPLDRERIEGLPAEENDPKEDDGDFSE